MTTQFEERVLVWYHRLWRRWTQKIGGPSIGQHGADRRMALCMRAAALAASATAPWSEIIAV